MDAISIRIESTEGYPIVNAREDRGLGSSSSSRNGTNTSCPIITSTGISTNTIYTGITTNLY